jgi:Arc/MetJ-type ribon-helix-helix transcriptional regulator
MTVDLTKEELKAFVKEAVREALDELLADPDEGKELTEALKKRLLVSSQSTEPNLKLEDVAKELGLAL